MSIITLASNASAWRGYEYYTEEKVLHCEKTGYGTLVGIVQGNATLPYEVEVNLAHPRSSKCTCPFVKDNKRICKHMVAVYFTSFPDEAGAYIEAIEEAEAEEERRRMAHDANLRKYVKSLSKKELQEALYEALLQIEFLEENRYW